MELKVGDKVRIKNKKGPHWNLNGLMDKWMGKVVTINEINGTDIYIKEDAGEYVYGKLNGWNWEESDFVPLDNDNKEKLVVYRKGAETIGILKKNGKEVKRAVAKSRENDTYSFQTGAELVFDMIFKDCESAVPKLLNTKVVCIRSESSDFSKGKLYEVINGVLKGNVYEYTSYQSVEEINSELVSQFIEFVE